MPQPFWFVELIKKVSLLKFFVAKLTRVPLLGRMIDDLFYKDDRIICVPQDVVIQLNTPIGVVEDIMLPSSVVEYFIRKAKYHWIMNRCICRDSKKCKDYPINLGCLFLGEAAMKIDPKLGRHVTEEEALEHVKKCQEAGLIHSVGRNKLDTLWLGIGPGNKLLTICNCCPCCCYWTILPDLAPFISSKIARMPGLEIVVTDRCSGCGTCTQGVCFIDAIRLVDTVAVISEACRGCGRCVDVCPQKAIEVKIDHKQFTQASIEWISSSVDVS